MTRRRDRQGSLRIKDGGWYVQWTEGSHALRHFNNSLMLNEGVDMKTRMDRLGHTHDRVNLIYSHAGDQAQLAASEVVWQKLKAAGLQRNPPPATA